MDIIVNVISKNTIYGYIGLQSFQLISPYILNLNAHYFYQNSNLLYAE